MKLYYILAVLLISCTKEVSTPTITLVSSTKEVASVVEKVATLQDPFGGKEASMSLVLNYPKSSDNYYYVTLDTLNPYSRFDVFVEASNIVNPKYLYNGDPVISSKFDCNSYWIITESILVKIPLYSPFGSLSSSPYFRMPISTKTITVVLSQFQGQTVPIVQQTDIYLKKYNAKTDTYQPKGDNLWAKRIVGPIPKYFKGDTVTLYSTVTWDTGNYLLQYPEKSQKTDSVKVIFK